MILFLVVAHFGFRLNDTINLISSTLFVLHQNSCSIKRKLNIEKVSSSNDV